MYIAAGRAHPPQLVIFFDAATVVIVALDKLEHRPSDPDAAVAYALQALDRLESTLAQLDEPDTREAADIVVDLCARIHRAAAVLSARSPTFS